MLRNLKLQPRFTLFILVVTLPLLIGAQVTISFRANALIEEQADRSLRDANNIIATDANTWLEQQYRALQQTANLADVTSMDPVRQKNALIAMAQAHPNLYLIHTLDVNGFNVARSDATDLDDYSDREYFKSIISGEPIAYQAVIGRTAGQPALVLAVPILNGDQNIIGVMSSAGLLDDISKDVTNTVLGETGIVFVIDVQNQIVAHTDPAYTKEQLQNFSQYPPVAALRQGEEGLITFTDENNVRWRAFVSQIDNGWGFVVQQTESELLAPINSLNTISAIILALEAVLLAVLSSFTITRLLKPIQTVTKAATAISGGELDRVVNVDSQDEIGDLAVAFNNMTAQLRELISGLEKRVDERTADLTSANQKNEKRARQFEAVAQVARATTSNENLETLLPRLTILISEQFSLYHTGIFLLDDDRTNAVLRATNSEGGKRMLARGHKLQVGQAGMVGFVSATGNPRIALDVGTDAVFFDNPDLPNTRSEMALPLRIADEIVGVLDVQSTEPNAFLPEDIEVLSTLADQVSTAIQNSRSFEKTQQLLQEAQRTSSSFLGNAWQDMQQAEDTYLGYRAYGDELQAYNKPLSSAQHVKKALELKQTVIGSGKSAALAVPIRLRNEVIGIVDIRTPSEHEWDEDEVDIAQAVADRLSLALETSLLLRSTQRRAELERVTAEISGKIGATTQFDTILRTAAEELSRVLGGSDVLVQIQSLETPNGSDN